MWLRDLLMCLHDSYRGLDDALEAACTKNTPEARPALELVNEMNSIADSLHPPGPLMAPMDAMAFELCRRHAHAGVACGEGPWGCASAAEAILRRCRLPLCQMYVMLSLNTCRHISASVRSVAGKGIPSEGAISVRCMLSGVDRRLLTDPNVGERAWGVLSKHMEDAGMGWIVDALNGAAQACGHPPGGGGVLSGQDIVALIQSNCIGAMPSMTHMARGEDVVVLGVYSMLMDVIKEIAHREANRLALGQTPPNDVMVAKITIEVRAIFCLVRSPRASWARACMARSI